MVAGDTDRNGDAWVRFVSAHDQLDETLEEAAELLMNLELAREDARAAEVAQQLMQPVYHCITEVRRLLAVLHPTR